MLTAPEEQSLKTEVAALRDRVKLLEKQVEALELARPLRAVSTRRLAPDQPMRITP